jgi:hypothetical protein
MAMARRRVTNPDTKRLFRDLSGQKDMFEKSLEEELEAKRKTPVECLGMTFENDEKRREYFLEKLREKLKDPEFRKIEGFPIGSDDDILALSDPPYYTACPNPFIQDFIRYNISSRSSASEYNCQPLAREIPERRHDPIGLAHSYHTKISHMTIEELVHHYTKPTDIILDSFCGSGMTGVGIGLANSKDAPNEDEARICIQFDLSPVATRLAYAYCLPFEPNAFTENANSLLEQLWDELGWMYTYKFDGSLLRLSSAVWCETYECESCGGELVPWDENRQSAASSFRCNWCGKYFEGLRGLRRYEETYYDVLLKGARKRPKRKTVLLKLKRGDSQRNILAPPEKSQSPDFKRIEQVAKDYILHLVKIPYMHMTHERNNLPSQGIEYLHDFYTLRNFIYLTRAFQLAMDHDRVLRHLLWMWINSTAQKLSLLMCYNRDGIGRVMKGVYYVPRMGLESGPDHYLRVGMRDMVKLLRYNSHFKTKNIISTSSATSIPVADESIDYIFIDPPFGGFQLYADLNFLWEAWMGILTKRQTDIIVDGVQKKGSNEYQALITRAFRECGRVIKSGRWMTLKFHNSSNAIWTLIQQGLLDSGFVVANVAASDKKLGTTKQITDASTVRQDLIISAYKPNGGLEDRFKLTAGTEEGVWDFVRTHLKQLPVFVSKDGQAEVIAERQNYLLFDRMVAFHVQRGVTVPLSAAEFYKGLTQRFPERDGMYFLPDQVAEYDKKRMSVKEILQLELFVIDESSAIQWLKQQLIKKPQTFQELHPQFLKEIGGWQKHEKPLELSELLEQNFLRYDGKVEVPSQIHSYLSSNFKELRNLPKNDESLRAKAKDRWYVPDPNKAGDLEKLRERALIREFEKYRESKQKRLKVFRLEAVRAGFKKAWQERDYGTIIAVARKILEKILQEDPKLLMWYDQALTRSGED